MSCLDNLHKCQASCCKTIGIILPPNYDLRKNQLVQLKLKSIDDDVKWYYELHNIMVNDRTITFIAKDYVREGRQVYFVMPCKLLNDNFTCKGHPDDYPELCKSLTSETANTGRFVITPGCIYEKNKC